MKNKDKNPFHIPLGIRTSANLISKMKPFFLALGKAENILTFGKIRNIEIKKPIYISGLARSGTTATLEFFNGIENVVTHKYRDFPFIYTPILWISFLNAVPFSAGEKAERPHGDGISVNLESPESMEEMLWMAFFKHIHNPQVSNILTKADNNIPFNTFYKDHIKKILLLRKGSRYVSKANYNMSRVPYIVNLFPDAKFIFLIRDPYKHIASFLKQTHYIQNIQKQYPSVLKHFQISGHFEYGLDMRPINTTNKKNNLTENKNSVKFWATYWNQANTYLKKVEESYPKNCRVFRFEDLCTKPKETLIKMTNFADINVNNNYLQEYSKKFQTPTYYKHHFNKKDSEIIEEKTKKAAELFGYI